MRTFSIGRSAACDIVLRDPTVSRTHAVLTVTGTGAYRFVDQFERITAMFDRLSQRGDRRAEQPHKFADRADAVLIAPFPPAPRPCCSM